VGYRCGCVVVSIQRLQLDTRYGYEFMAMLWQQAIANVLPTTTTYHYIDELAAYNNVLL